MENVLVEMRKIVLSGQKKKKQFKKEIKKKTVRAGTRKR